MSGAGRVLLVVVALAAAPAACWVAGRVAPSLAAWRARRAAVRLWRQQLRGLHSGHLEER